MCYDTALTKLKNHVQAYFEVDFVSPNEYKPYYHQSGFDHPTLQIIKMQEPDKIYPATWGYVPTWGMEDISAFRKKYNTLNIRSENLFSGISKEVAHHQRCLIIADGFFEPHKIAGESVPYFCYIPSKEFSDGRHLFAFGGVYSENGKDGSKLTCSLLTMDANPFFAEVHNVKKRQPFVVEEELYREWFNSDLKKDHVMELINNGFTSREFTAHPVSGNLYKKNIDTNKASSIEEVPPPNLLF